MGAGVAIPTYRAGQAVRLTIGATALLGTVVDPARMVRSQASARERLLYGPYVAVAVTTPAGRVEEVCLEATSALLAAAE